MTRISKNTNSGNYVSLVGFALVVLLFFPGLVRAQIWTKLTNAFPGAQGDTALLLTNGAVLVHVTCSANWYKLTPDNTGSYINGTWSAAIPMQATHTPQYFASAVLADGRVVAVGGEYNVGCAQTDTNLADIYDPATNSWSVLTPPPFPQVGDGQSVVLPNKKFVVGHLFSKNIAQLDPTTLTWTTLSVTGKADNNSEEGWTLLPNSNKFLTVDANPNGSTGSEIYDPTTGTWTSAGSTGVAISNNGGLGIVPEVGPAILRPNGTVYQAGATTHNSVYNTSTGLWTPAADFPSGEIADGPAALLPSGNVLVGTSGFFTSPTHFYEFNGTTFNPVPGTTNAGIDPTFVFRFLLLPTGQVLSTERSTDVEIYTPASVAPGSSAWRPTISSFPAVVGPGDTYPISGTQFNGLSQAVAYGDDAQAATNYPLVQITNTGSGHVFYNKTHDHSTMAVATDGATVSTNFDANAGLELGASTLVVIANGIPSMSVPIIVEPATTLVFTGSSATTSNFNDAATVSAKLTATSGGAAISGKTITFVLGAGTGTETCTGTTDATGVASCSITPNETPGAYTLTATFASDASFAGSSVKTSFTITKEETVLAFTATSATTSNYHDAATVQAQLIDPVGGAAIAGKSVTFVLGAGTGTETCTGTTDATGKASCSITPNEAAGVYALKVSFAGDAFDLASSASTSFTITKEETTTTFTASSPTVIANGHTSTFSAILKEDGVTPIAGRTITITLGTGSTAQTCTGTTNATGTASCSILVNQPLGPNTVAAAFAGDAFYKPSSASEPVILFAFLDSGSMIIGNLNTAVGTMVDFWGAQWTMDNALTGGPAPDAFKGFANPTPQACGGTWISDPGTGNSTDPPASLPSYMGVIASSSIVQSGDAMSGNVPAIVVVKTNRGYGPAPGQMGTGTVVAVYCH